LTAPSTGNQNVSGRVTALAFLDNYYGPNKPALLLGSASGGLFLSSDLTKPVGQITWSASTDTVAAVDPNNWQGAGQLNIGSIAVVYQAGAAAGPNVIYAGTGEGNETGGQGYSNYGTGVLQWTSATKKWSLLNPTGNVKGKVWNFVHESIPKIIVDPTNDAANTTDGPTSSGETLYAAVEPFVLTGPTADDGIYKSRDGGLTWQKVSEGANGIKVGRGAAAPVVVTDMEYTRVGGKLFLYAAVGDVKGDARNGVWRGIPQADGTVSWTRVDLPEVDEDDWTDVGRIALASQNHTGIIYAALTGKDDKLFGFYRTQNNGLKWENPVELFKILKGNFDDQGSYNLALGVSPAGLVYLGGSTGLVKSSNQGKNWALISGNKNGPHVDHHAFAFSGRVVYEGNDGGVWRYTNDVNPENFGTWVSLNNQGLQTNQINGISQDPSDSKVLLEGSQDNGHARTEDTGTNWKTVGGGDGMAVRFAPDGDYAYKFEVTVHPKIENFLVSVHPS
jgi:hypothetical protein